MDTASKLLVAEDALQRLSRIGCDAAKGIAKAALERIRDGQGAEITLSREDHIDLWGEIPSLGKVDTLPGKRT